MFGPQISVLEQQRLKIAFVQNIKIRTFYYMPFREFWIHTTNHFIQDEWNLEDNFTNCSVFTKFKEWKLRKCLNELFFNIDMASWPWISKASCPLVQAIIIQIQKRCQFLRKKLTHHCQIKTILAFSDQLLIRVTKLPEEIVITNDFI